MRHLLILSFLLSPIALCAGCWGHDRDDDDHDHTVKETKVYHDGDRDYTRKETTVHEHD